MHSHAFPVQCAIRIDKVAAEGTGNRRHGGALRGRHAAGNGVGIDHGGPAILQHLSHGAFAAADATGQTQAEWRSEGRHGVKSM